jgi:non-heme chloroperoxidase
MKSHTITGGGNTKLHVVETGNTEGRAILFLHGFSQCVLSWSRQLDSDLARDHRLVAMDLRGHGMSEKPREGYDNSKFWADDVNAAISMLRLERPILCGWSYGPLIALDYIRHYGEDSIGGLHFVGGISRLGSEEALAVLSPEFLGLVPGFFSTDIGESVLALESLVRMCLAQEPSADELYLMMGFNVSVPPYVRQGMLSRAFDNEDLLPKITKPVLITHGVDDAVVKTAVVDQFKSAMGHAQIQMMPNAGHAPFWDDSATFNRRLQEFAEGI